MSKKIVFMGTPEIAGIILEQLMAEPLYAPQCIITQPDQRVGKKQIRSAPPVKIIAQKHHLMVWQPESLRDASLIERLQEWKPDCIIVAAYGKMIPKEIWSLPPYQTLNIHPSLLPRYRGPSPVPFTLLAGDQETGVTIMRINAGMDTGDILAQTSLTIEHNETALDLQKKLFTLGGKLLINILPQWFAGKITPIPQQHQEATITPLLKKADGMIQLYQSAREIERMVRAFNPWPGVFLSLPQGRTLKIHKVKIDTTQTGKEPLALFLNEHKALCLATREGTLILEEVQCDSKKPMSGYTFFLGFRG